MTRHGKMDDAAEGLDTPGATGALCDGPLSRKWSPLVAPMASATITRTILFGVAVHVVGDDLLLLD